MKFRFAYLVLPALLIAGFGCPKSTTTTGTSEQAAVGAPSGPEAGAPTAPPAPAGTGTPSSGDGRVVTVSLRARSDDNEWGKATLTDLPGNQTRIVLTLVNAPRNEAQTAAIHGGACADLGAPVQYALNPVVKGTSTTTLNVNLTSLLDKSPQSIRVKMDAVDPTEPLAACGNLN